jgi:lysyl-tRNA synthetase class 2
MLESLYRFNAKFHPDWQPRSVLFRSWGEVGWLGAAALAMEFSLPLDRGRVAPAGARLGREPEDSVAERFSRHWG